MRVSFIFFASLVVLTLSGCKKDYTCECIVYLNGTEVTRSETTDKMTKKEAESTCNTSSSTEINGDISETKCHLK